MHAIRSDLFNLSIIPWKFSRITQVLRNVIYIPDAIYGLRQYRELPNLTGIYIHQYSEVVSIKTLVSYNFV